MMKQIYFVRTFLWLINMITSHEMFQAIFYNALGPTDDIMGCCV